jgi:hypothetical protein
MACMVAKLALRSFGEASADGGVALDGAEAIERVNVCTDGFGGQTAGHIDDWHNSSLKV